MGNNYNIISDPEANILYQKCRDVDESLWEALARANPEEVERRTGVQYVPGKYLLPFLNRTLLVYPGQRQILGHEKSPEEPEFQLCLTALLFLLNVDANQLPSRQVSPKEYKGGVVFFQGPHALPTARLEESLGVAAGAIPACWPQPGGHRGEPGGCCGGFKSLSQLKC